MKLAKFNGSVESLRRAAVLAAAITGTAPASLALAVDKYWVGPWGTWSTATNWSPTGMPGPGDAVNIGDTLFVHDIQVFLNTSPSLSKLHLFNGIWMDNQKHPITVNGPTTIAGFGSSWSRLWLRDAVNPYDLATGDLNILAGSSLFTVDTPTILVSGKMTVDATSDLIGSAVINFTGNSGPVLVMDGGWSANGVSQLTLNQLGTGRIDLDGSTILDNFYLTAASGGVYQTLTVNGTGLHDEFDDIFWMSQGNQLNMNLSEGWTLGGNGKLFFTNRYTSGSAQVNGGTLSVHGTIEFATGLGDIHPMVADINAPTSFGFSSKVIVGGYDTLNVNGPSTVNAGSFALVGNGHNRLKFNGATTLSGGTFTTTSTNSQVHFNGPTQYGGTITINGTAVQNGAAKVTGATVINAGTFDLDGDTQLNSWELYAPLTINAQKLDISDNLMSGTIDIRSTIFSPASLTVNLPANQKWTAGGLLKVMGSGLGTSLTVAGSDVALAGEVQVNNGNAFGARADFLLGSLTTINSSSWLQLAGGTVATPNTITGGSIVGSGTLNAPTDRALVGYGTIAAPIAFAGTSELRAKDGMLQITGAIHDVGIIGTANNAGILHVTTPWNSSVADKVELKGGRISGATLTNDRHVSGFGTLSMGHLINSGSIAASGGTLTIHTSVAGGPDLDGSTESGQLLAVNGNIRVLGSVVEPFNGSVHVGSGRLLRFDNGWTNNGNTNLTGTNASPATMSSGGTQHHGGTLSINGAGALGDGHTLLTTSSRVEFDLKGSVPGATFDRLTATGSLTLGGKLALSVDGNYFPAYLQAHEIVSAGAINGVFATIDGVALAPNKYLAVTYDADSVFVRAALPGDADLNGTINLADFNALASHFGSASGATWATGDFNGDGAVTLQDFNALAGNFGIAAGMAAPDAGDWAALASAVPEPSSSLWIAGPLAWLSQHRRRRSGASERVCRARCLAPVCVNTIAARVTATARSDVPANGIITPSAASANACPARVHAPPRRSTMPARPHRAAAADGCTQGMSERAPNTRARNSSSPRRRLDDGDLVVGQAVELVNEHVDPAIGGRDLVLDLRAAMGVLLGTWLRTPVIWRHSYRLITTRTPERGAMVRPGSASSNVQQP